MPKISVIVPIYGVEKYLKECLDSILSQTFSDMEIILIDDGSKDNCPQIVDEYAKKDNRIVAIHKENGGYGSACNLGLKTAKGEYISIIEPDDYINPKMYEDLYEIAKKFDSDIVKSSFYDNLSQGNLKRCKKVRWDDDKMPKERSFKIEECPLFLYYHPSIWSCIYKKEFLDKHNITFVEAAGAGWSDNPFQVQTMCLANRINYTPRAYYCWRRLNENESDDIKDWTIPFKRCDEIHTWLNSANINDSEILNCINARELSYILILLNKKYSANTKSLLFEQIKIMLGRMDEDRILNSKYINKKIKRELKLINKNLNLYYLRFRFKKLLKFILSIKLSKNEKRIVLFGRILFRRQSNGE